MYVVCIYTLDPLLSACLSYPDEHIHGAAVTKVLVVWVALVDPVKIAQQFRHAFGVARHVLGVEIFLVTVSVFARFLVGHPLGVVYFVNFPARQH